MTNVIRRRITLQFETFEDDLGVSDETLAEGLRRVFGAYEDGRFPFCVETINAGMSEAFRYAIHRGLDGDRGDVDRIVRSAMLSVHVVDAFESNPVEVKSF